MTVTKSDFVILVNIVPNGIPSHCFDMKTDQLHAVSTDKRVVTLEENLVSVGFDE